jgi:hypothetical protein
MNAGRGSVFFREVWRVLLGVEQCGEWYDGESE